MSNTGTDWTVQYMKRNGMRCRSDLTVLLSVRVVQSDNNNDINIYHVCITSLHEVSIHFRTPFFFVLFFLLRRLGRHIRRDEYP